MRLFMATADLIYAIVSHLLRVLFGVYYVNMETGWKIVDQNELHHI